MISSKPLQVHGVLDRGQRLGDRRSCPRRGRPRPSRSAAARAPASPRPLRWPWSSGSTSRCRPCGGCGTSSVKRHGPRPARSRTASSSAGVAAVRFATTRTRAGVEDSMRGTPFGVVGTDRRHSEAARGTAAGLRLPDRRGPSASKASTTPDRTAVPEPVRISSAAASTVHDSLYGRSCTSTSKTSATCDDPRRDRDVLAAPGRPGSRRRPSARGGGGRSARRPRSASEPPPASTRAPSTAWVLTTSNSSSVSRPGLSRIESGIAILPMSCSGAAWRTSRTSGRRGRARGASRAARWPTRCVCSWVLSSR